MGDLERSLKQVSVKFPTILSPKPNLSVKDLEILERIRIKPPTVHVCLQRPLDLEGVLKVTLTIKAFMRLLNSIGL